ncbi:MAG: glycosyltransferase family 2 protein [Acidobacteria bacterium]|nr:glycosyltransferase family 2 protein [Acidobacteriota bacterium]
MKKPGEAPLVSVVIPNYNGAPLLQRCLCSLAAQTRTDFEVVLVDNASDDGSIELASRFYPQARILRLERNLGFAGGANAGLAAAWGEWVAVLNNDTEAAPDWIEGCAAAVSRHPDAAFFACRILAMEQRETLYSAGDCYLRAGVGYRRGHGRPDGPAYDMEITVFSPCGCAALYRRSLLKKLGGFDERLFAYLEDVELGLRMQMLGHVGYYIPQARVYHIGSATSGGEFSPMTVRLRTRNSILLLLKTVPASILGRTVPMILAAQTWWLLRALRHGRLACYLRGLGEALRLTPSFYGSRRKLRGSWTQDSVCRLWQSVLASESLARQDYFQSPPAMRSRFLGWYFGLFRL